MVTYTKPTVGGTFVIRNFKQEMYDSATESYTRSSVPKTIFTDEGDMLDALTFVLEIGIRPSLTTPVQSNNANSIPINWKMSRYRIH